LEEKGRTQTRISLILKSIFEVCGPILSGIFFTTKFEFAYRPIFKRTKISADMSVGFSFKHNF